MRLVVLFTLTVSLSGQSWRQVSAPWQPSASHVFRMTYDSVRNECMLMSTWGGSGELYSWDGTNWQVASNNALTPGMTSVMALAHDPVRDRLLVIDIYGSMREWDGSAWHYLGWSWNSLLGTRIDICWHATLQRIVTIASNQIWQWSGTSWSALANLPPGIAVDHAGFTLAYDVARDVLLAAGDTTTGPVTLEWDGTNWATFSDIESDGMRAVYAPSLGGIFGYRLNQQDSYLWDPAAGEWTRPNLGGTPGVHSKLATTYDQSRQRLVMFCPSTTPTWEYDPNHTHVRRTFIVGAGPTATHSTLQAAANEVVDGDRIIVQGGSHSLVSINYGVQVDCPPGTFIQQVRCSPFFGTMPATITNVTCDRMHFYGASLARVRNCTILEQAWASGSAIVSFENSTLSAPTDEEPFIASGSAIVTFDSCVVTGADGYYGGGYHIDPTAAVEARRASTVVVINSSLTGGNFIGHPGQPAASGMVVQSTATALVIGSSSLTAGSSSYSTNPLAGSGNITASLDTTWAGTGAPANWIPNQSWLDAPLGVTLGQTFDISANVQPGDSTLIAYALDTDYGPHLFGSRIPLLLDAASAQTLTIVTTTSPTVPVTIPNNPAVSGLPLFWQGLTISATDGWQLTNRRSTIVQ